MAKEEQFKTSIGGQALIEGIMMRGPEKDAIVVRGKEGLDVQVNPRKIRKKGSVATWPLIRGVVNFFDSQVVGVKALMHSADLSPEELTEEDEPSKLDLWLEKKLGDKRFQNLIIGISVALGLCISIALFFLLPMVIGSLFSGIIHNMLVQNMVEGLVRIVIFVAYMLLISRMKDMKRVFAYHGAEHKTIRCYEAGEELTVENVRSQTRLHPRCGTSFLFVVMILSIFPGLVAMREDTRILYNLIMIVCKLAMLPVVVSVAYEINRWAGRHDNVLTRILTWPGMWFQNFTTNEPDDAMIEVGIAALQAVLPEQEGTDLW